MSLVHQRCGFVLSVEDFDISWLVLKWNLTSSGKQFQGARGVGSCVGGAVGTGVGGQWEPVLQEEQWELV